MDFSSEIACFKKFVEKYNNSFYIDYMGKMNILDKTYYKKMSETVLSCELQKKITDEYNKYKFCPYSGVSMYANRLILILLYYKKYLICVDPCHEFTFLIVAIHVYEHGLSEYCNKSLPEEWINTFNYNVEHGFDDVWYEKQYLRIKALKH